MNLFDVTYESSVYMAMYELFNDIVLSFGEPLFSDISTSPIIQTLQSAKETFSQNNSFKDTLGRYEDAYATLSILAQGGR